jgi:hypothetical protein
MEPEAPAIIFRERTDALIAFKSATEKRCIMKAGEEREIIHGIAGDGIIEVDESLDAIPGSENVPKGEILVNETASLKLEQGVMIGDGVASLPSCAKRLASRLMIN